VRHKTDPHQLLLLHKHGFTSRSEWSDTRSEL